MTKLQQLTERLAALEAQSASTSFFPVVLFDGAQPTPEEAERIAAGAMTIAVTFVEPSPIIEE